MEERIRQQDNKRQPLCRENQKNRNIHHSARHYTPNHKTISNLDQHWLSNFKTLRFTIDDKKTEIDLSCNYRWQMGLI